ncbi:MAG: 5'/3'-nucleotidase SurE [Firmicutes bacterium]|nr:5'/3'-nucleotidase SurE [Bacillota bacterium]
MRILITNDDGIGAPGIRALANIFKDRHDIIVVAPSEERSAASHGIISMRGLSYKREIQYDYEAYSVSGFPADCVKLAILHIMEEKKPDLVLSGINRGKNLGTDVMYSGTVSAAFEAIYMGVPGIAISASYNSNNTQYEEVAKFILNNLTKFLKLNLPKTNVLNINYPTKTKIIGSKVVQLGRHLYGDKYFKHGEGYILDGKSLPPEKQDVGHDLYWYNQGYITLTPIQNDRNDYKTLERIKNEWKD